MLRNLLRRQLLIVVGKGGVGRTSVCAALGLLSARNGRRVLLIEIDSRAALSTLFGQKPVYQPAELAPGLHLMALDGRHALEQYLSITLPGSRIVSAVLASRLYNYFVQAAPGLRELIMIGKLLHEIERRPAGHPQWDNVIFDAPASGHALSLFRMPFAADNTFGSSVVGRESRNVATLLRDLNRTAFIQVATAEPLALAETVETHAALREMGLEPAAIVMNRMAAAPFGIREIERLERRATRAGRFEEIASLVRVARAGLRTAARRHEAITDMRATLGSDVIEVPEIADAHGLELVERIVERLDFEISSDREAGSPAAL
jgi:anion-transporting  ArsA/GET3 family ATPase